MTPIYSDWRADPPADVLFERLCDMSTGEELGLAHLWDSPHGRLGRRLDTDSTLNAENA